MAKPQQRMDEFTPTQHHAIYPSIDPSLTTLPSPFTVCIIGASSGIGEHVAYTYARAGASGIIVASRRLSELDRVAAAVRALSPTTRVLVHECDIASAPSVATLAVAVHDAFGRLDVLVPNSGYAGPVTLKITEGEPEWFRQNFEVNTLGTYHAARYFVPLLLGTEGGAKAFLCVGSLAARIVNGPIANTGYCLSKFAQSRFIEYLEKQYGAEGLLAVLVHPGAVLTPMAAGNTPEVFMPYLVDSEDLCGAFCVWVSKQARELAWLNGRFLVANWDVKELLAKKEEIIEKDMLKWNITMS